MENNKNPKELINDNLNKVTGGGDTDSLKFKGKDVPLPEPKSKKPNEN